MLSNRISAKSYYRVRHFDGTILTEYASRVGAEAFAAAWNRLSHGRLDLAFVEPQDLGRCN